MARKGRKQLAVLIKEESFGKFEQIKEDLGLSNAKLIEMLIENYVNTSTNTQKSINTNTNINTTEEILRKILKEELACINTNTNTNTNTPENKKVLIQKVNTPVEIMEVEDEDDDNTPAFASSSEDIPEWQKRELTPQDFYGKVPEPYTKGPYDHDPQRYLDEMLEEEKAKTEIKPKKPEIDDYVNPFL